MVENRHFFHTPLAFDAPVKGVPSEHRHPVWHAKTRMAWLPDGEKTLKTMSILCAIVSAAPAADAVSPPPSVVRVSRDRRTDGQMDSAIT